MYLRDAKPWAREEDERATQTLAQIIADHQRMVQLLTEALLAEGAEIDPGAFPMEYTDLHDLSYDYLLRTLIAKQRQLLREVEECAAQLGGDPLALEAVGLAKGHLESLKELVAQPAGS